MDCDYVANFIMYIFNFCAQHSSVDKLINFPLCSLFNLTQTRSQMVAITCVGHLTVSFLTVTENALNHSDFTLSTVTAISVRTLIVTFSSDENV